MAGKKYVLLVDHHSLFAKAFCDHFLKKNPQVDIQLADNAREALKFLSLKPCDLLIADLRLPEVDGLQLLLRVRQSFPHLTKIVMAAYASPRDSQKAIEYGSLTYVEKPTTPSGYDKAVEKVSEILAKTPQIPRGALGELELDSMVADGIETPQSCVLVLYAEAGAGRLYLEGGRVVHAETPESRGGDALKEMLGWQGGPFEKRTFQEPQKRTLDIPWEDVFSVWMEEKSHQPAPKTETAPKSEPAPKTAAPAQPEAKAASKAQVPAAPAAGAKPTEPWVRVPAPTTMGVKPAPRGEPTTREVPPPPSAPTHSGDFSAASTDEDPTKRLVPAPRPVSSGGSRKPAPASVASLNEKLLTETGIQFAIQIDAKGKLAQDVHCPEPKLYTGVATFTAAKARELAQLFQWDYPRSVHFINESIELCVLPFDDQTVLIGWKPGGEGIVERIGKVLGAGLLDPTSSSKPRLPATIDAMKKIPGLHGYAIFNKDHQILVKKFSAQWNFDLLQNTSRITSQMCMVLQLQKLPVKVAQIKFDAGSIFAIPCADMMLITVCHHQSKVPLLKDCLSRITANEINKAVL
jgi:CheY-like chemotaxis protein